MSERILGSVRLSRLRLATQTGVDKQEDAITEYARSQGVNEESVIWVEDTNVSGGKSPFVRPGLGPWLTDPEKMAQYDIIVAAKLDRLGRNARDLYELRNWATDNGKRLLVTSLSLEWPAKPGIEGMASRVMWDVLGELAQAELEAITERLTETWAHIKKSGKWTGSTYLYGFKPVCACHGYPPKECTDRTGTVLIIDEAHAEIHREIALRVIGEHPDHTDTPNGESIGIIIADLNNRGIPSPTGKKWVQTTVSHMLHNPASMGYSTYYPVIGTRPNGRPKVDTYPRIYVHPETGEDFKPWPEIIDPETFSKVQDKLTRRARGKGNKKGVRHVMNTYLLTGVIQCPCKLSLYHQGKSNNGLRWDYYAKRGWSGPNKEIADNCSHPAIPMAEMDNLIHDWIAATKNYPITERRLVSGGESEHGIRVLKDQLTQCMADYTVGRIDETGLIERQSDLLSQIAELKAKDDAPVYDWIETNRTIAGEWVNWSTEQRNTWLKDNGVVVIAERLEDKTIRIEIK